MFNPIPKFQGLKSKKGERKWWLFHATDFQSLMYPCFTFCRILGVFPYKIDALSFETSKPYYILSIIIICVFCFCVPIMMMNVSEWFNIHRDVRRIIEIKSCYIIDSFITIFAFVSNGLRMRLLRTILKISSILPSEVYQKQSMLIHIKDIFGSFFLLVQQFFFYHYNGHFSIVLNILSLYIDLLTFQIDMLYINCVCVLKASFKKINDDLANLLIMNDESHSIHDQQRNLLLLMELNTLKKRHLMASDIVKKLNIIFSPQILGTIIVSFNEFTFELFFNTVEWQNGLSISLTKQIYTYSDICNKVYITYKCAKLMLIVWACETGKNEATKISTTIHDVLNSTTDEQIKYEVLKI